MFFRKAYRYRPTPQRGQKDRGIRMGRLFELFVIPSFVSWPFLRLQLPSAIEHNRKLESEDPKLIAERSRWKTLSICYIHMLPITVTAVLLLLNFRRVFYESVGISNQSSRLNAFQFAAKMHEVLIAASLSAIVLNYVQYEILHGSGVPLGGLLAGFQVTNIGSLWSPGFWATACAGNMGVRRLRLVVLIVLMVALAAIVGPASAILMLPSLGYWNYQSILAQTVGMYDGSFPGFSLDPGVFIGANDSILWPDRISTSSYPPDCNSTASSMPDYCPLGGLSALINVATPGWVVNLRGYQQGWWNFTTQFFVGYDTFNRFIEGGISEWQDGYVDEYLGFLTQTTPLFADQFLVSINNLISSNKELTTSPPNIRYSLLSSNGSHIRTPTAYAACSETFYQWTNGSLYEITPGGPGAIVIGNLSKLNFPLDNNKTWSSDVSPLLAVWNNSTGSATLWVEPPDLSEPAPSIGVVFAKLGIGYSPYDGFEPAAEIVSCSLFAYWQPAQIYINPSMDSFIHSSNIDEISDVLEKANYYPDQDNVRLIKFDIDWANSALPPNETVGELTRQTMGSLENNMFWTAPFGVSLSIFVADVMSRLGMARDPLLRGHLDNTSVYFNLNTVSDDSTNFSVGESIASNNITEFQVTLLRYGYSYSMDGLTRRFAAGILLAHTLVAMIYMTLIIWFGWSCYGFRSVFEVVVLAINSPPSQLLDNTCAGISRLDTYKHVVKVREISDTQLGLVLDDNRQLNAPVDGKKYGRPLPVALTDLSSTSTAHLAKDTHLKNRSTQSSENLSF